MAKPVLEAYELLIFAHQTSKQLSVLAPSIAGRIDLERERTWLQAAVDLLASEVREIPALVERVRWLPELKSIRQERTGELIDAWVDSLEKLLAGITFHLGSRHPLIEAVFTHQRFPQLRRAAFETAQDYWAEIERRLRSSYVERMLASEPFAFARPVVAQARATWAAAAKNEGEVTLPAEELSAIGADLQAMAERLELALKQARLLAEAATLRFPPEVLEETGLTVKPKKRPGKGVDLPAPKIEVTETWEPTPREPEPEAANERQAIEAEIPGSRLGGLEDAELTLDIPEPQPETLESELPTAAATAHTDSAREDSAQEDSASVVEVAEVAEAPAPAAKPASKKGRRPATRELLKARQPEAEAEAEEKPANKKEAKAEPEPKKPAKKAEQPEPERVEAPAKRAKAKPAKKAEPAEPEHVEAPQAPAKKTETKPAKKTKAKAEPAPIEVPATPDAKAKQAKAAKREPEPVQVPEAPAPKPKRAKAKPAEPVLVEVVEAPATKAKRTKVAKPAEPAPVEVVEAPATKAKRTKVATSSEPAPVEVVEAPAPKAKRSTTKPAEPVLVEVVEAPATKAKRTKVAKPAEPAPVEVPEAPAPKAKRAKGAAEAHSSSSSPKNTPTTSSMASKGSARTRSPRSAASTSR